MLTDAQCRNATCPPDKKRERLTDSAGLYLEISLKFPRRQREFSCSINDLRWIAGLGF